MTTLTTSWVAAGQTTTVWVRPLVSVSSRRPGRPAISGADWPVTCGPRRGHRALGVEGGQRFGVQAVCLEDREDDGPFGAERPRPTGEADLR